MRNLAILSFVTLDGVMQSPSSPQEDPSDGFTGGGWAADYWENVMSQVRQEAMSEPYDILFGRKTYEIFASHFPKLDDADADARKMNEASKYVATNTLNKLDWQNSVAIRGDILAEVAKLKSQDGPLIQIHGSTTLIQTLLAADLIDEFRLWTFPVVVGSGKRLFGPEAGSHKLKLVKSAPCSNGAMMSIYQRQ
ncbi:MAG: dihydrofolate reductase family protein [Pseudomonadota bacterium]